MRLVLVSLAILALSALLVSACAKPEVPTSAPTPEAEAAVEPDETPELRGGPRVGVVRRPATAIGTPTPQRVVRALPRRLAASATSTPESQIRRAVRLIPSIGLVPSPTPTAAPTTTPIPTAKAVTIPLSGTNGTNGYAEVGYGTGTGTLAIADVEIPTGAQVTECPVALLSVNVSIAEYPGSSLKEGREDSIDVFGVCHTITQPVEPTTGQATGVRVHSPFVIVKKIDKASPGLNKALVTGQNLAEVVIDYYRVDPQSRAETAYYKVTLRNARVASFSQVIGLYEEISFVYEEIEWNWLPDSIEEMDKWRAPGGG